MLHGFEVQDEESRSFRSQCGIIIPKYYSHAYFHYPQQFTATSGVPGALPSPWLPPLQLVPPPLSVEISSLPPPAPAVLQLLPHRLPLHKSLPVRLTLRLLLPSLVPLHLPMHTRIYPPFPPLATIMKQHAIPQPPFRVLQRVWEHMR